MSASPSHIMYLYRVACCISAALLRTLCLIDSILSDSSSAMSAVTVSLGELGRRERRAVEARAGRLAPGCLFCAL
ncbi:hypothetical protein BD413DRAFT_96973 [Trametes elegans]|nr:hypothetical protein BD413DRAFT_96973 [Trametes elegans]